MKDVGVVHEQHQSVRQGFEVEDLTTRRNWMWVYEPDKHPMNLTSIKWICTKPPATKDVNCIAPIRNKQGGWYASRIKDLLLTHSDAVWLTITTMLYTGKAWSFRGHT